MEQYRERLSPGIGRKAGSYKWFEIQDNTAFYQEFEKPKIIYQKFQVQPAFTVDDGTYYINDAMWMLTGGDYYLLGVLNSKMGWYEISRWCTQIQNGYQLIWDYFKNVRIPDAPEALRQQIATVAQQCLDAAKVNPVKLAALEAQLNRLVYQAYGLDEADIRVIEGSAE